MILHQGDRRGNREGIGRKGGSSWIRFWFFFPLEMDVFPVENHDTSKYLEKANGNLITCAKILGSLGDVEEGEKRGCDATASALESRTFPVFCRTPRTTGLWQSGLEPELH